jgi:hypothetical protein
LRFLVKPPDSGIRRGVTTLQNIENKSAGGEGGIRTPDTRQGMSAFEADRFNHSRTSPHWKLVSLLLVCFYLATLFSKKALQNFRAASRQHSARDLHAMI